MSVLVVEDDIRLREFLEVLVRRCGLTSHAVTSGEAALEAITSGKYTAVVLDLMLPGISGFEVLRSLRITHPHLLTRIIVLTAVSQTALDREFEFQPFIWQLIRKPFDIHEFVTAIQECARFNSSSRSSPKELSRWIEKRCADGAAKAAIVTVVSESRELRAYAAFGFSAKLLKKYFPVPLTAAYPLCSAVRNACPVWLASMTGGMDYPLLSIWTEKESKAIAIVPLKHDGHVTGAIGWSFPEPQRFDERQRADLQQVASDCLPMVPIEQRGGYLHIS